jgi:acyl-coenzyme A thioesterase PaaI-like protein
MAGDAGSTGADERTEHARAAAAVRRLGHALIGRDVDPELLERVADEADDLVEQIERAPRRSRLPNPVRSFFEPPTRDSPPEQRGLFRESIVSGDLNALGVAADLWREGDVGVMEVTLGPAFEGAPGRSHGGIVAAMFDETMGIVLAIHQEPAFTGRLSVTYRAGTPVGVPVTCRCWLEAREGRKLVMAGELRSGELLCAEAEATFIIVDRESFADGS